MLPSRSGILVEGISIASTSLQQRQSISLVLFLQCPHFKSSRPASFCKKGVFKNFAKFTDAFSGTSVSCCKFCEILKDTFFHRIPPTVFTPIEISYSNTVCNKSATEAWVCLVSFYGGEWWSERLHFCKYFPQNYHFLHWDIWNRIFSISFTGWKFSENLKKDHTFNNKLLIILKIMFIVYV